MTVMDSLGMLGLLGQARAPTQAQGPAPLTGPPGATDALLPKGARETTEDAPAREIHAAFAALLQRLLALAPGQACGPANAAVVGATPAPAEGDRLEGTARSSDEQQEGAEGARRCGGRKGARAPDEPTMAAPIAIPPDLIQGAVDGEPAPEPDGACADNPMAVAAVAPVGEAQTPIRAEGLPPSTEVAALAEAAASVEAAPSAPAREAPLPESADPPAELLAPRAAAVDEAREAERETADVVVFSAADTAGTSDADAAQATSFAPARSPAPAKSLPSKDEGSPPHPAGRSVGAWPEATGAEGGPPAEARAPARDDATPAHALAQAPADGGDASTTPRMRRDGPPVWPSSTGAAAREATEPRPGRQLQGVTAERAPVVLPGSARAQVEQWLHGAEGVDATQARQQAQRLLASSLVDDIRRLTFVGQDRALLQLQPPELGRLSIRLDVHEGGLSLEMLVETEAVRAIVESTLGQLQSALAQHGLATAHVYVGVGQSAHREGETWRARHGREVGDTPSSVGRVAADAPPQTCAVGFGSTVDYRI